MRMLQLGARLDVPDDSKSFCNLPVLSGTLAIMRASSLSKSNLRVVRASANRMPSVIYAHMMHTVISLLNAG